MPGTGSAAGKAETGAHPGIKNYQESFDADIDAKGKSGPNGSTVFTGRYNAGPVPGSGC
jgi:hypothetical protein